LIDNRKPTFFYGYIIVLAAFFIQVLAWGTYNTFGVFFLPMSTEFGWTRTITSAPRSLCFLLFGLLGIVAGRLNDRFGPRLIMAVCGLFLGLGYLLMSQINAIWQFYLFYGVIVALGMSATDIVSLSTVARWFARKRGTMTGIVKVGAGVGMVIAPLAANWLIFSYGWRSSYLIIGLVALVFSILAAQFLRRDPGQMELLPDGDEMKEEKPSSEASSLSLQQAMHTAKFWILSAVFFVFVLCAHTVMTHLYPHAVDIGISPAVAANILATIGGASMAGRFIMGIAGDRIGNKSAFIIDLTILAIAFLWLQVSREAWMLYIFAVVYGFAHGGLFTLISPMVAELFGLSSHGIIFGTVNFSGTIGGTVGPVFGGFIFDTTGSYQWAFLSCIVLSIIGIILTLLLRPTQRT